MNLAKILKAFAIIAKPTAQALATAAITAAAQAAVDKLNKPKPG
jgi:hypothetical protein